jgi:hypothetical protein
MTPEQREKKKQADRDRRARLKAQGLDAKAIRAGAKSAKPKAAKYDTTALTQAVKPKATKAAKRVKAGATVAQSLAAGRPKTSTLSPVKITRAQVKAAAERKRMAPESLGEKLTVISFRGTSAQKSKFDSLGGGHWARAAIDAA